MDEEPIPEDFPRERAVSALTGAQPKVAVRIDARTGAYFAGQRDEEIRERYDICVDLVDQLVAKCQKNRSTKYASLTEAKILAGLFDQLTKTNWGSREEMAWIIRHTAFELGWPLLDVAEQLLIARQGPLLHA